MATALARKSLLLIWCMFDWGIFVQSLSVALVSRLFRGLTRTTAIQILERAEAARRNGSSAGLDIPSRKPLLARANGA